MKKFLLCFFLLFPVFAFATIPQSVQSPTSLDFGTQATAACAAAYGGPCDVVSYPLGWGYGCWGSQVYNLGPGVCFELHLAGTPQGHNVYTAGFLPNYYGCPANSSASGSSCTCSVGFVESAGACTLPNPQTVCDQLTAGGVPLVGTGSPSLKMIYNGVQVTGGGAIGGFKAGSSTGFSLIGPYTCDQVPAGTPVGNTGNPLGAATSNNPSTCSGAWGNVNGQDVCVPKSLSNQNTVGALKADSSTSTTSGGVTTGTTTTGSTTCDGSACTTTKTTTTSSGATSTTQEVKPQADFCSANPASPLCASSKSECEKNPDSVGCMKVGDVPSSDVMTKTTRAVGIVAQTFTAGGSCPAPLPFSVIGRTFTISYQPLCDRLAIFRVLFIALGGFIAAFILADSFRV